jgi:hypothetical protein
MLSTLVNLYDMRYTGFKVVGISAYFSIVVIAVTVVSVVAIFLRLQKFSNNMTNDTIQEFNKNYSPLISDLRENTSNLVLLFWKALNLIRWLLTLTILTTLNSYPVLQMIFLIIFSLVQQILILKFLPYESKLTNAIVFINELAVTIYLYISLLLSDYLECQFTSSEDVLKVKVLLSWVITLMLCCVIGINCIVMFAQKIMQIKSRCISKANIKKKHS